MRTYVIVFLVGLGLITQAVAQGHGNRGVGAGGGQRTMSGTRQGSGQQSQQRTQQQDRQRIHATAQQQTQYQDCVQASQQLRNQVRQMTRLAKKNQINKQNALQLREQLRAQVRAMEQQHEQLVSGLDSEQSRAVQSAAQKASAQSKELSDLSDALDFELQQEELNTEKVRTQSQRMEASVEQLQQQYRAMNNEISLE